ncbi:DnaJ domain-containing protein [Myriangium duriaei CBS 260.36]|uniref:DnaJ domain-containing protein n=1 Tax=Myriangium duriaei CBS 260.36 TaxID=1168546 RepID=A0A9P4MGI2_9PEZI|nr:DnaJ domain-containing protein [Myriangium duriaei CBS 260.36]
MAENDTKKPDDKTEAELLSMLEKDGKEFDKDAEIERILAAFRLNGYAVLDLQPGVPDTDIKKTYRTKSLLIHPDKTSNPKAPDAFDRLAKAQQQLMDEKARSQLDESIADARMLLMRERKLTVDSEEVKDPDDEFIKAWRAKTVTVMMDDEKRRQRQMKAQMQEEGRQRRKEDEEMADRKRKREHEQKWENSRDERIGSWRDFQKGGAKSGAPKKKAKMKTLG